MSGNGAVIAAGAVCFGVVVGYVTYRSLARSGPTSSVSDIAAVIGAVGGGVVTSVFDPAKGDSFGYYSIGLLVGMGVYVLVATTLSKRVKEKTDGGVLLGGDDPRPQ